MKINKTLKISKLNKICYLQNIFTTKPFNTNILLQNGALCNRTKLYKEQI